MKNTICFTFLLGLLCAANTWAAPQDAKSAIEEAAKTGQYLLLTFYETKDTSFSTQFKVIEAFRNSASKKVAVYYAKLSETVNKEVAAKYGIQNTKDLPLTLVIASNGAITGGFPKTVTQEQIKQSVSVQGLMLQTLKLLQEQKVALVALQNKSTKFNTESWQGVSDFANDAQYKQFVGVVKADPAFIDSQEFIKQCGLSKTMAEATVVVLLPPGQIGKIITGKTTKADILAALQSCSTSGGSGCCPAP